MLVIVQSIGGTERHTICAASSQDSTRDLDVLEAGLLLYYITLLRRLIQSRNAKSQFVNSNKQDALGVLEYNYDPTNNSRTRRTY